MRRLLDEGVLVSLGTDVSGGAAPSMLTAVREALKVSNLISVTGHADTCQPCASTDKDADAATPSASASPSPLSFAEAYWLATVGGAKTLGVDGLTGDFRFGSLFDALVIDPSADGSPFDLYDDDAPLDAFQKWLQLGDDRNTAAVYVSGQRCDIR